MPRIPSLQDWKSATSIMMGNRGGDIVRVDRAIDNYHRNPHHSQRRKLLIIDEALKHYMKVKTKKYGDYRKSKRHKPDNRINFETLHVAVIHLLRGHATTRQHSQVRRIAGGLTHVKIADVDFSDGVKKAARNKMVGDKNLYDTVKEEWDDANGWANASRPIAGHRINQTPRGDHETAMNQATLRAAMRGGLWGQADMRKIADAVTRWDYAVCESITATVLSRCLDAGVSCHMEALGIQYTPATGHMIAVFDRVGELNDPTTWGGNCFIVDLWYFNLGMRPNFLYVDRQAEGFIYNEILKKNYKVKQIASFN